MELVGRAEVSPEGLVPAPLTRTPCCWFRFKVEKKGDKSWRRVDSGDSGRPILLDDGSGQCWIHPEGADVTPAERSVWFGHGRQPAERSPPVERLDQGGLGASLGLGSVRLVSGRYRYTEERILPGDTLYAIGHFQSEGERERREERTRRWMDVLRDWKRDGARLRERFDHDRNGQIDPREWEDVRQAAYRLAARQQEEALAERVPHRLGAGGDSRHPFLISALPQMPLARRYRHQSVAGLVAFFLAGALCVSLLGARLAGP